MISVNWKYKRTGHSKAKIAALVNYCETHLQWFDAGDYWAKIWLGCFVKIRVYKKTGEVWVGDRVTRIDTPEALQQLERLIGGPKDGELRGGPFDPETRRRKNARKVKQ